MPRCGLCAKHRDRAVGAVRNRTGCPTIGQSPDLSSPLTADIAARWRLAGIDLPFDRALRRLRRDRAARAAGRFALPVPARGGRAARPARSGRPALCGRARSGLRRRLSDRHGCARAALRSLRSMPARASPRGGGSQGDEDRLPFADGQLRPRRLGRRARHGQRPARRADPGPPRAAAGRPVPRRLRRCRLAAPAARGAARGRGGGGPAGRRPPPSADRRARRRRSAGPRRLRACRSPTTRRSTCAIPVSPRWSPICAAWRRPTCSSSGRAARSAGSASPPRPPPSPPRPVRTGGPTERFHILHLSGWAPSPDQPKPARRGSGTASLADALKPKS